MALIHCPECNKEVSDKAEICVHCGYPISKWIKEENSGSSQSNEDIKDDNPNNIYLYREKEYNLTELVDYIKENTYPDVEINSQTWVEARHILRTYISIGKEEDLLISYIHKYRMLGTTKDRKKYYEHKKAHVSHTQFNYVSAYSNKNNMYNPSQNVVRCPHCGSTSVTTEEQGYGLFGWIGASQKKNLCQKCGHKWWPGR